MNSTLGIKKSLSPFGAHFNRPKTRDIVYGIINRLRRFCSNASNTELCTRRIAPNVALRTHALAAWFGRLCVRPFFVDMVFPSGLKGGLRNTACSTRRGRSRTNDYLNSYLTFDSWSTNDYLNSYLTFDACILGPSCYCRNGVQRRHSL